jgi:hypothetical protein
MLDFININCLTLDILALSVLLVAIYTVNVESKLLYKIVNILFVSMIVLMYLANINVMIVGIMAVFGIVISIFSLYKYSGKEY